MARTRNYAAEYARRQARARERGFTGYYERRTRRAPGAAKPSTAELRERRGHASAADLKRELRPGDLVSIEPLGSERNAKGQWKLVEVTVLREDGSERVYRLRGSQLSDANVRALVAAVEAAGAIQSPSYPLSRLQREHEEDDEEQEEEEAA